MTQQRAQIEAIAECEARIGTAFARIGAGIEALQARAAAMQPHPAETAAPTASALSEAAAPAEAAPAEAALSERVQMLAEKQRIALVELERRLSGAETELGRLRRVNRDLVEANQILLQAEGELNGPLADMALRAELAAMRAERQLELTEVAAIVAAIDPLIAAKSAAADGDLAVAAKSEGGEHA